MRVNLKPAWELTDEHAASSDGHPVLADRESGHVFGWADLVQCYPSWRYQTASKAVERMARLVELSHKEKMFVEKFVNLRTK